MECLHIGFLHPGAMGVSLAATAQKSGHATYWASAGRSRDTITRAEEVGLIECKTMNELCDRCTVIISVCAPHAATQVAEQVLACAFKQPVAVLFPGYELAYIADGSQQNI